MKFFAPLTFLFTAGLAIVMAPSSLFASSVQAQGSAYDYSFTTIDGEPMPLSAYKGKILLIVNTASKCGFVGQFGGLQALHEQYAARGLVIIAVPSDSFNQEFKTASEVKTFCANNYQITFPMTQIEDVTGSNAHPFYQWAGKLAGFTSRPKWNFHKYIIGADGRFIDSFGSFTNPISSSITNKIDSLLSEVAQ